MKWALENKCDYYDFRGVSGLNDENHPQRGIYIFKKGFNGDIIELIDEMYVVYNPVMNTIFNISKGMYDKISNIKDKFKRLESLLNNNILPLLYFISSPIIGLILFAIHAL